MLFPALLDIEENVRKTWFLHISMKQVFRAHIFIFIDKWDTHGKFQRKIINSARGFHLS